MSAAVVTPADRLTFTVVLSILVHALLLFGIRFVPPKAQAATSLEVTLVPAQSEQAPEKTDFIAQANQQGSGTEILAQLLSTRERTRLPGEADAERRKAELEQALLTPEALIVSSMLSPEKRDIPLKNAPTEALKKSWSAEDEAQSQRDNKIAALEARLSASRQAYAKRPRIETITAVSAKADDWAAYLEGFRVKIEAAGNANYPAQARSERLEGQVRLLVALLPNGRVQRIDVLQSSGLRVLDQAARASVRQAQPFEAFPAAQQGQVDVLQIIRTWRFSGGLKTTQ
jgi:protein TonB